MEKPDYQPNIWQAILLLLLYIGVFTMVPGLFFMSLSPVLGFNAEDLLVEAITMIIGFTLLVFWIQRRYRIDYRALFGVRQLKLSYIIPMIMMMIGAMIIISEIDNLLRTFMPPNHYWSQIFKSLYPGDQTGIWKFILVAVIVAPLIEEMIFRGVLLKGFIKHYPPHRAIFISAILFGLAHLNPWQFWGGVIWGCIAGWWFYEIHSLIPCITGHLLINFVPVIFSDILKINIPGFTVNYHPIQYQPLWFDLLGTGLLMFGIIILIKLFRSGRKFLS